MKMLSNANAWQTRETPAQQAGHWCLAAAQTIAGRPFAGRGRRWLGALAARLAGSCRSKADLRRALAEAQAQLDRTVAQRDALAAQVTLDPLTGVQNRRGLEVAFENLGAGTVLALLDIDHFKKINDTLGHDVGDRVLRDFARLLRSSLNDSLPVYRVGGEEFVVLFPDSRMHEVAELLAGFRQTLMRDGVTREADAVAVSFSAGLARRDDLATGFAETFKRADARLYDAKTSGRGKTVCRDRSSGTVLALAA